MSRQRGVVLIISAVFKDDDEEGTRRELVIEIFFRPLPPPGSVWCSPVSYTCKFPWTWMQGERGRKKVEGARPSRSTPLRGRHLGSNSHKWLRLIGGIANIYTP
jgi:hypothetical protein